jgi:hypothetical protein
MSATSCPVLVRPNQYYCGILLSGQACRLTGEYDENIKPATPGIVESTPGELRAVLDAARADGVALCVVDTRPSAILTSRSIGSGLRTTTIWYHSN